MAGTAMGFTTAQTYRYVLLPNAYRIILPPLTSEFLNNLKEYGNMISAGIPLILSRLPEVLAANGRQPPESGDMLILLGAGICMEDIAEQMTAGCACLEWSPLPTMAGVSS